MCACFTQYLVYCMFHIVQFIVCTLYPHILYTKSIMVGYFCSLPGAVIPIAEEKQGCVSILVSVVTVVSTTLSFV